ncbi:hypothetical protein P775_08385 [Puniceibacterium antarcticum]|uniref:Uncharacterized protein n=1 Tax=Puniceibacterium antarcticum TaxID=1206336 RepID=A0A2G8RG43_9RHOB|nr:hypothetical protein [Puniceibacterium antarcticum]PIL20537.1 hypothetical protein P775_08385 [Puniceibacterium antarcticum]
MCSAPKVPKSQPALIAAPQTGEAASGNIEARLRQARSGAAANILTSPLGLAGGGKLGGGM